ncbi:MAG: hypothetical protein EZS28_029011 [Streblomastix strix]|uniref:Uncharacterized protein n=1 Tax=Streblomastix strix TaxID=222440 RepID=A0A5J4UZ30_9EUKA|nr:MAG: hypothetical protein EZS28_029011 [Streblomastix strix]
MSEVDSKLTNYVNTTNNQEINGTKTFNSNVNAAGFAKTGKDDTSILLAGGGDRLLSDFSSGGASIEDLTSQVAINITATGFNYSSLAFIKIGNLYQYQMQVTPKQEGFAPSMNIKIGTLPSQYAPTVSELYMPVDGPYDAFKPHICSDGDIRCYTVNDSWIQQINAAGLSDFPELYAYIKERYPKPIGELPQPVPIGDQTLQQQVKNNDDIIYASNEVFEPPVPNAITKLDLSSQLERNSFLASSGSDPTLIVYGDRITLTASYATTGVFPNASNEASNEAASDSFIYEVIIKHEKQLGLNGRTQEVGRIPDSILPADGKKPQESIPTDSDDVYKYCASGMYYL